MAYISTTLSLGALGLVVFYYARTWFAQHAFAQRQGCQLPPKRNTLDPIFGLHYKIQDLNSAKQLNTLPTGAALHRQYGSTYRESSVFGTTLKTTSEENIHTVFGLRADEWGVQPFRLAGMRPFCGEGILSTDGPVWEHSRTMLKPFFHKSNISDLTTFERSVAQFLVRIPKDGSTIDLDHLISMLFVDTSTRFTIGQSLGLLSDDEPEDIPVSGESFLKAFQLSLRGCGIRCFLGVFRLLVPKSVTVEHWQVVHKLVDFYVDGVLRDNTENLKDDRRSLLEGLAHQTRDRLELRNQTIHTMMAAQDTTARLVSNTVFLLSRSPDIWERLRAEIASTGPVAMNLEDTRRSKLLRHILNESLRLYPVFPIFARDALQDTILPTGGGLKGDKPVFAPAGTRVVADFYTLHRDETIYGPCPEKFDPDRWNSITPSAWQYLAFGGGPRTCLGQHKALGEASYTLIRLAQSFQRLESRDDRDWAGELQLAARNINGCNIALRPA